MSQHAHMTTTCANCPYRKDAPRRHWDAAEFHGVLNAERSQFGKVYACHKQKEIDPKARGFCAGWLLNQKKRNIPSIALRLHLIQDPSAREALEAMTDGGHPMFASVEAMCRANGVRP